VGNDHPARRYAGARQRGFDGGEMMARNILVGDDGGLGARAQTGDARAERSDDAAPDHDVIAAGAERDLDGRGIGTKGCRHTPAFPGGDTVTCKTKRAAVMNVGDDGVMRDVARMHGEIGCRVDRLALGK